MHIIYMYTYTRMNSSLYSYVNSSEFYTFPYNVS